MKPVLDLIDVDGNAFNILNRAVREAKRAGFSREDIESFRSKATSGDYKNLISTLQEVFDVRIGEYRLGIPSAVDNEDEDYHGDDEDEDYHGDDEDEDYHGDDEDEDYHGDDEDEDYHGDDEDEDYHGDDEDEDEDVTSPGFGLWGSPLRRPSQLLEDEDDFDDEDYCDEDNSAGDKDNHSDA